MLLCSNRSNWTTMFSSLNFPIQWWNSLLWKTNIGPTKSHYWPAIGQHIYGRYTCRCLRMLAHKFLTNCVYSVSVDPKRLSQVIFGICTASFRSTLPLGHSSGKHVPKIAWKSGVINLVSPNICNVRRLDSTLCIH